MALKWTRGALRQLDQILDYIAADNPVRATSFAQELKDKVGILAVHPGLGRPGRVPGTRELVLHRHYLAIYRVVGDEVQVLRIHHTSMRL